MQLNSLICEKQIPADLEKKIVSVPLTRLGATRSEVKGERKGKDSKAILSGSQDPLPPKPLERGWGYLGAPSPLRT